MSGKTIQWILNFVSIFMVLGMLLGTTTEAQIINGPRDLIMNAGGEQGYINNSWLSGDTRFTGNTSVRTDPLLFINNGGSTGIQGSGNVNVYFRSAASQIGSLQNTSQADLIMWGDGVGASGSQIRITGTDITFGANNTVSIGTAAVKAEAIYAVTNGIGDLREEYLADPAFTYSVGEVVALSTGASEIKPVQTKADRIIGVVAQGPRASIDFVQLPNGSNGFATTQIPTHEIIIYGKTPEAIKVMVKGTIAKGDYLVASDTEGVVTSMYNTAHPLFPTALPASTNVNTYNQYAKLLPNLGIAMEAYNSPSVGTIVVLVGK